MGDALITRRGGAGGGKIVNSREVNAYSISSIEANSFVNINDDGREYTDIIPIDSAASASTVYNTGTLPFVLPLADTKSLLFYNVLSNNNIMVCVCNKTSAGVSKGTSLALTDFNLDSIYNYTYVLSKYSVLKLSETKVLLAVDNNNTEGGSKVIILNINGNIVTKAGELSFTAYTNFKTCTMLMMDSTHVMMFYGKRTTTGSNYSKYASIITVSGNTISLLVETNTDLYAAEEDKYLKMVATKADANTVYVLTPYAAEGGLTLFRAKVDYGAANIAFKVLNIDTSSWNASRVNAVKVLNSTKLLIAYTKLVNIGSSGQYYARAYSIVNITETTLSLIETKVLDSSANTAIKNYGTYSTFTIYPEGYLYEIDDTGFKFFDMIHCPADDVFKYAVVEVNLENTSITVWGDTLYRYDFAVLYKNLPGVSSLIQRQTYFDQYGYNAKSISPKKGLVIATDGRIGTFFSYYRFEIDLVNKKVTINYAYKMTPIQYFAQAQCCLMCSGNNVSFAFVNQPNSEDRRIKFCMFMVTPDIICADNIKLNTNNILSIGVTKNKISAKNVGKMYVVQS